MKRTKLIASLMMCVFCLSFLVVGVWAAVVSVNFNLNAGLKYYPEGVYVELSGQVYRGSNNIEMNPIKSDSRFTLEPITNFDNTSGEPSGNFPIESWNIGNITFPPTEKFVKISVNVRNLSETSIRGIPVITMDNFDISTQTNFNVTDNSENLFVINSGETVVYELLLELVSNVETTGTLDVSFNFESVPFVLENGKLYIYMGNYPQTYVGDDMNNTLESWYSGQSVTDTYTVNTESVGNGTTITYNAYTYIDNNVYVRVPSAYAYTYYDQTFNNGTSVVAGNTYWFKVEPIKWRVLTENYTDSVNTSPLIYLLCENILFGNSTSNYVYYNGNSSLRSLLENYFYNDAFTSLEKDLLITRSLTPYDSMPGGSTGGINPPTYSSSPLNVWASPSHEFANETYGFVGNTDRQAKVTDFAFANYVCKKDGYGAYWTSSFPTAPYYNYILFDGSIASNASTSTSVTEFLPSRYTLTCLGARPAILID